MKKSRCALLLVTTLLPALSLAGACGKLKPSETSGGAGSTGTAGTGTAGTGVAGNGGKVLVTVSGTAAPHPLNAALGASDDFSMLKVAIVDPAATIIDPNAAPLGSMTLDMSTGNCDATAGCKWSLAGINITNQTLGLVGTLEDTRTGDARVWVKTGTGMGTAADLAAVRAAPAAITMRQAFIVSRKLEAKLGAFVGAVLKQTFNPGELEARGFLIGHVVGKLSSAPVPAGVAGAKVAATGDFDVIYPNADFSGAGTVTAGSGLFLMVPHTAAPVVTMWEVVPPPASPADGGASDGGASDGGASDGGADASSGPRTWAKHLAGSNPNNAFVIIMPADE